MENRLKEIREKRGFSVARLSGLSGVPASTIYSIEAGVDPLLSTYMKLLKTLEVDVKYRLSRSKIKGV